MNAKDIPIIMISLRDRPDRTEAGVKNFAAAGITNYKIYYGFNGKTMGVKTDLCYTYDHPNGDSLLCETCKQKIGYKISNGICGCALSWMGLIKHCLLMNYSEVLILEDDYCPPPNFMDVFSDLYSRLPSNYELFILNYCCEGGKANFVANGIGKYPAGTLCTDAMLWTKSSLQFVDACPEIQKLDWPWDVNLQVRFYKGRRIYHAVPKLGYQLSATGQIRSCM